MYITHEKQYARTHFLVMVHGLWVMMSQCECGPIHSYEIIGPETELELPKKSISDLTSEIRKHLLDRVPHVLIPPSHQLTCVDGNKL